MDKSHLNLPLYVNFTRAFYHSESIPSDTLVIVISGWGRLLWYTLRPSQVHLPEAVCKQLGYIDGVVWVKSSQILSYVQFYKEG